jgi:hypothetical protein
MYTFQSVYDHDSKNFSEAVKLCDAPIPELPLNGSGIDLTPTVGSTRA